MTSFLAQGFSCTTAILSIAAGEQRGFFARAAKWLLNFDYDLIQAKDRVTLRFLGLPKGWGLLIAIICLCALVWLTFRLYRREGRTASPRRKFFLATLRTITIALAALLFIEPTLVVTKLHETLSPVLVMLDASESMTIEDFYADKAAADSVAAVSGLKDSEVFNQRVPRTTVVNGILNNPQLNFLNRLAAKNPVDIYTFADVPRKLRSIGLAGGTGVEGRAAADPKAPPPFIPGEMKLDASGGRTYIGSSIKSAIDRYGGRPIAAAIIFTDGQDNDPDLDATITAGKHAAHEGVPVFPVPIGLAKSRQTKNIRVDKSLRANRTLFVGDPAEFSALVSSSGYTTKTVVQARLFRQKLGQTSEQEVAAERIDIKPNTSDQPVTLTHTPLAGDEGEFVYVLKIEPLEDEQLKRDNIAMISGVRVVKTTINVLLIAGSPTWEYRRLRDFFVQDKTVILSCWLQSAGQEYAQGGDRQLNHLPKTDKELFDPEQGYHVIILVDVDLKDFGPEWFKLLEEFVDEKMGGLLYIAGEKFTYELFRSPASALLRALLPVELDMDRAPMAVGGHTRWFRAWPLKPTEDGLASPLLRFSTEREMTERIWQSLPGSVWSFPVKREKPGASVLLRTLDPQRTTIVDGKPVPMPAFVTGFYGSGRTAFMAFDESWRWRKVGIRVWETFWTQVVRSLIEGRLLGGKKSALLETDNETYPLGEPVRVTAKLSDERGKPLVVPSVTVKVERTAGGPDGGDKKDGAGQPVQVKLRPVEGAPGLYRSPFVPSGTGHYKLTIVGSEADAAGGTTTIEVASQFEFDHPDMNMARLVELVDESRGGRVVELRDLAALPDSIASKKKTAEEPGDQFSLWANPLMLGLLTLLLGVEWAVRKRSNMA